MACYIWSASKMARARRVPVSRDQEVVDRHLGEPRIASTLIEMLRAARARGRKVGFRQAWEVLRWRSDIDLAWDRPFRLNNNLASRFARLVLLLAPDLEGAFSVRAIRGFDPASFAELARAQIAELRSPTSLLPPPPRPLAKTSLGRTIRMASITEVIGTTSAALHAIKECRELSKSWTPAQARAAWRCSLGVAA
jgi:hypothetical protein